MQQRWMWRAAAAALVFSTVPASAQDSLSPLAPELAPLEFLTGHCWEGELAPGLANVHCFAPADGGARMRDHHEVSREGVVVYSGDTIYEWDGAAGAIRFTYSSGGETVGEGHVRAIEGGLDFGNVAYATANGPVMIASRWMRIGDDMYEAADSAPGASDFDRTVRYRRRD